MSISLTYAGLMQYLPWSTLPTWLLPPLLPYHREIHHTLVLLRTSSLTNPRSYCREAFCLMFPLLYPDDNHSAIQLSGDLSTVPFLTLARFAMRRSEQNRHYV